MDEAVVATQLLFYPGKDFEKLLDILGQMLHHTCIENVLAPLRLFFLLFSVQEHQHCRVLARVASEMLAVLGLHWIDKLWGESAAAQIEQFDELHVLESF